MPPDSGASPPGLRPDLDQWLALHATLVPDLYRCVSRRVGADRALAEDIAQEAWLRAIAAWRRAGLPRDPGAWLRTAAFNVARNHFRRSEAPLRLEPDQAATVDDEHETQRAQVALMQWGLARLREQDAALLVARHFDRRPLADLAREHRTTERAIEGRLHRARAALASILRSTTLTVPPLDDPEELQ
ncbi:MAG: sigma-70 family RNA polymerase sigma factor [Planctomycetota bacterium]